MYQGVVQTAQKLREQRQELSQKSESNDLVLSQTDLINKTNVEVAKHLINFMHEYLTSIEVKNLPENLAKTDDIRQMLNSIDDLIVSQAVTTSDLAEELNSGIEDLIIAIEGLRESTADKSEDAAYTEKICEELQSLKRAISDANTAVLKGDKTEKVVSAVKTLEKAVKSLKMAPVVNVAPTPVDLTGIEEKIAEIPSKINIPQTVIPENDYSALEAAIKAVQDSIENIVFPVAEFPTTVKVTNPDGTDISGGSGSSGNALASYYLVQDDDTSSASYEYYGYVKADGSWVIKRVTVSSSYAEFDSGASGYATAWTNRATGTYADYWSEF